MIDRYLAQKLRGEFEILEMNNIKPNFSEVARRYEIDRHTVAAYWNKRAETSLSPKVRLSEIDPYFDEIKAKAEEVPCTKMALFKFYQDKYGHDSPFRSYSTFAHYLQRKELTKQLDCNVHPRYETPPGKQLQLDWKEDLSTMLSTGEVIEYNLFVATFGYSRYHYYIYTKTKTTEDFLRCLIEVLHRAGGVPQQLITDNMTAIVAINGRTKYKHAVIKQFENDLGVKIHLCKIRTPQTKGKVESANRFVQWLAPYNNELDSEEVLIDQIRKFNVSVNEEPNETTGIPPVKLLKKEMEHLSPIPNKVLINTYIKDVSVQTVPPTLLVRYKGSEYSVPPKFIGHKVKLIPTGNKLYVYFNTDLIAIHDISARRINYRSEDYLNGLKETMPSNLSEDELKMRAEENLKEFDQLEEMKDEL